MSVCAKIASAGASMPVTTWSSPTRVCEQRLRARDPTTQQPNNPREQTASPRPTAHGAMPARQHTHQREQQQDRRPTPPSPPPSSPAPRRRPTRTATSTPKPRGRMPPTPTTSIHTLRQLSYQLPATSYQLPYPRTPSPTTRQDKSTNTAPSVL
eukprot:3449462-Rhodomonas_salina.1